MFVLGGATKSELVQISGGKKFRFVLVLAPKPFKIAEMRRLEGSSNLFRFLLRYAPKQPKSLFLQGFLSNQAEFELSLGRMLAKNSVRICSDFVLKTYQDRGLGIFATCGACMGVTLPELVQILVLTLKHFKNSGLELFWAGDKAQNLNKI